MQLHTLSNAELVAFADAQLSRMPEAHRALVEALLDRLQPVSHRCHPTGSFPPRLCASGGAA